MNTDVSRNFDIKNGPSRDTLIDAFKYAYDKNATIDIDFGIALFYMPWVKINSSWIPMKIKNAKLTSIEHEDGSGNSFNIRGYCDADLRIGHFCPSCYKSYKFKAYYNTKNRTGTIAFLPLAE